MNKSGLDAARRVQENVREIQDRIADAAKRSGRTESDVELVGVTKYVDAELTRLVFDAGVRSLGESRPQQLASKCESLADVPIRWHMIGPMQRNKVRRILPHLHLLQSADRWKLIAFVNSLAEELDLPTVSILLEVNISGEAEKHGFVPDQLPATVARMDELSRIQVRGLMGMASRTEDESQLRRQFASLRLLREQLRPNVPENVQLDELSIGMTGDYEVAIEEGATLVRVGSGLFRGLET